MNDEDMAPLLRGCCVRGSEAARVCRLCAPKFAAIDRIAATLAAADRLIDAMVASAGLQPDDGYEVTLRVEREVAAAFRAYSLARSGQGVG